MSFWQRALDFLIDPNLIALMLSIGLIGIVVELWNPGLIFPGTVGAISLILGLYGLQVLPVSLAGLLLMLLAARLLRRGRVPPDATAPLTLAGAITVRARRADALRSGRATRTRCRFRSRSRSPGRSRSCSVSRSPASCEPRATRSRSARSGLVGDEGVVRREGLRRRSTASSGARTPSDGSPLVPGDHVTVERVEEGFAAAS